MTEERMRTMTRADGSPQLSPTGGDAPLPGSGMVRFGGVLMVVVGGLGVIDGLVALFDPTYFVTAGGAVLTIDLSAWGWVHLILGVLALLTGLALVRNAPNWARGVGAGLVAITMIVQLAWLPAYPIWSIIAITLGMIIIFSLLVTWRGGVNAL
jgi:hypothetical protein